MVPDLCGRRSYNLDMANGRTQNNSNAPARPSEPNRFMVVTDGAAGDTNYSHFNDIDGAVQKAEAIVNEHVTADIKIFQLLEVSVPAVAAMHL